jgi:hypothetical protein
MIAFIVVETASSTGAVFLIEAARGASAAEVHG